MKENKKAKKKKKYFEICGLLNSNAFLVDIYKDNFILIGIFIRNDVLECFFFFNEGQTDQLFEKPMI